MSIRGRKVDINKKTSIIELVKTILDGHGNEDSNGVEYQEMIGSFNFRNSVKNQIASAMLKRTGLLHRKTIIVFCRITEM